MSSPESSLTAKLLSEKVDFIRIHPKGSGRVSNKQVAIYLHSVNPDGFKAAQNLLVATQKFISGKGFFSTPESRLQKVVNELLEIEYSISQKPHKPGNFAALIAGIGGGSDDPVGRCTVIFDFLSLVSDAFPNWQHEYEALNEIVPAYVENSARPVRRV